MIRLLMALLLATMAVGAAPAVTMKPAGKLAGIRLAPHRAIYEIALADRADGVSVTSVVGRMVFELTGSSCEGYTQNMRMVTRITDDQGKDTYSDLRSSTWEKGNGGRFRFTSSHYYDQVLQEIVSGTATRERRKDEVKVRLTRPSEAVLSIPGDALFPSQHSVAILRAAMRGQQLLKAQIYDGSEQGQGLYQTYAFIGDKAAPVDTKTGKLTREDKRIKKLGLGELASWPVAISYFDKDSRGDSLPSYELTFRLYPNGVSRSLLINYGDFSVRGTLDSLTFLRSARCR